MQFSVVENAPIAKGVYHMRLLGDTRGILRAGQFVQIRVEGCYLRRPISVCDVCQGEMGTLDIVYKVVGKGTKTLSRCRANEELDILTGLGNGYDMNKPFSKPLLLGGGVGVPPLYYLAKTLIAAGKAPTVVLGFNHRDEVFFADAFSALNIPVTVTTVDGSQGVRGFVTDAMGDDFDYVFTCGPEPMLKAVYFKCVDKGVSGQFSFEERMACGFGACMGCSCKTKYGNKRICKDGPVLCLEEIIW